MHASVSWTYVIGIAGTTFMLGTIVGMAIFAAILYYDKDEDARKR